MNGRFACEDETRPAPGAPIASVLVTLVLLAAIAWLGCERARAVRPDVVLIVIDSLRASHLGSYGYERATSPFLDSFAERSIRYERAIATSSWTSPSVASIFSSLYPPAHGVSRGDVSSSRTALVLDDQIVTLAEVLQDNGYRTVGVVANPWISAGLGYAQGFQQFLSLPMAWGGYAQAARVNKVVYETVRSLRDEKASEPSRSREPLFLYVHYMDPHQPYHAPDQFHLWGSRRPPGGRDAPSRDAARKRAINRYDAEIRYLDSQLEELFAFLEEQGLYENSVVIITADHGEQLYEYGKNDHGYTLHNPEVHVPLLVKIPSMSADTIGAIVSTVDIFPTLLDSLDIEIPHRVQGVSLLRARRERGVYSDTTYFGNEMKAFTRGDGKKLIVTYDEPVGLPDGPGEPRRFEVFDSVADYQEKVPLERDDLVRELRSSFEAIYEESLALRSGNPPRQVELDDETAKQLEALGYLREPAAQGTRK